jgi:tRNA (mo5U34)-methyltransferase
MKNALAPPPPSGFDPGSFFAGVHWHQRRELFQGIWTPGRNPVVDLLAYAQIPCDLTGKRVLDIGAWNGGFTYECERRGASVVAYDVVDPELTGFNRIKTLIGSRADYVVGSVYDLHRHELGRFDIVLFFGVLYHLRYPLLALDQLRGVDCQTVLVESFVIDHATWIGDPPAPKPRAKIAPALVEAPIFQFYPGAELQGDTSN